jgi:hypothetical protein
MGLSTSKSTQTQNQNTTQTGTTTPNAPSWVTDGLQNYIGGIDAMSGADPSSFVAGASPLQQQAWNNAGALGGQNGNFAAASQIAMNAANAPASTMPDAAGYTAARGNASTYTPATLANPREASATGYNAAQTGGVNIDPTTNAHATDASAHQASEYMGAYNNPYQQQVIDTTLAGYDRNTAQQAAQMQAQAAKAGAFGGSRYGLAQGQFAADTGLNRASTEAQLRSQGFDKAAQLGANDAGAFSQASLFNAQNQTGVNQGNAAAANARAQAQAGLTSQLGLANMGSQNEAAQFGAGALNQASALNQGASNQFSLAQAGMQTDAAHYAADANNANTQGYLGRADQAAAQGAQSQNAASLFNAQQGEQGLNRQLQASQLLGGLGNDYATNTRADIGAMGALGDQQRGIEQAYDLAPLAQLQSAGALFGATPYQALVGQSVNSSGTMNGTTTTTQSPSLFNQLLAAGQLGMSAFGAFGGGGAGGLGSLAGLGASTGGY